MGDKEKGLAIEWFKHIQQLATDRKTCNGYKMPFQETLNEIKVLAKGAVEYLETF
jgi:hypothetical protein